MVEASELVKRLMLEGLSINEIQEKMHLTNRQLSAILKDIRDHGFNTTRIYSSDGTIIHKLNTNLTFNPHATMRINVKDKFLRAIFISDIHIGSIYERPELLKIVSEYAKKHNIHIIFNCGDVIDNVYPNSNQVLINKTVASQVQKVLRIYPSDPSITHFILYGNHDAKSLIEDGFDIARYIESKRYDMVSLGYGIANVHLKDDMITIAHDLKRKKQPPIDQRSSITFKGHSHKSKNSFKEAKIIYVAALSEDQTGTYEYRPLPSFLDVDFQFYDKKIERVNIKQLSIVNGQIRLSNEEAIILNPELAQKKADAKRLQKQIKRN